MAESYNDIIGLGSQHSEDANLESHYLFQDDAASTTVTDRSSNGRHGTLSGANTSDISTAGPNGYLPKALNFDGTHYVSLPTAVLPGANAAFSIFQRVQTPSSFSGDATARMSFGSNFSSNGRTYLLHNSAGNFGWRFGNSSTYSGTALSTSTWYQFLATFAGGSGGTVSGFLGASAEGTASITFGGSNSPNVGSYNNGTDSHWNGLVSELATFSRVITSTERAELIGGPEVVYSSGVDWQDDGTFDVGTWALPSPFASVSHGTPTYEVIAVESDGTVVDTAATATGTMDLSGVGGETIYLLVRATNLGGYDIGDEATRTSGYGSANDGYYELASVTAAGGGGEVFADHLMMAF